VSDCTPALIQASPTDHLGSTSPSDASHSEGGGIAAPRTYELRRGYRRALRGYVTIVGRAGVWPDSFQVPGGRLSSRLPTSVIGVALLGDRIAFVQATGESTPAGPATVLAVLDVASGNVSSLAEMGGDDGIKYVEFSPDGDQILFTRTITIAVRSLWSVRADGSDPHPLASALHD